jgi:hypothetical protein
VLSPHLKQFVLGPRPAHIRPDWVVIEIAPGLILSHCPKLRVASLRSRDNVAFHLLGLAVSSLADEPVLAEAFGRKDASEIEQWTGFWSGRWLLIGQETCWQDGLSFMGVHYRRVGQELWVSGSTALLGEHLPGAPVAGRIPWQIAYNKGVDWIPAPFSAREDVFKLLPLRRMNLRTGATRPVGFDPPGVEQDDVPQLLADALTAILANLGRCGFRDHLAGLTAGLDTRSTLTAACESGVAYKAFTIAYPHTERSDIKLPPLIAAAAGIPYKLIQLEPISNDVAETRFGQIVEHMDGTAFHPVWRCYAGSGDGLMDDPGRIMIAANCFEIGRCGSWPRFKTAGLFETPPDADQLLSAFTHRSSWRPEPLAIWRTAFETWLATLSEPLAMLNDWRDRFDLDQRCGCWHANLALGYDIFEATRFCPASCLWLMHLLNQFPPPQRMDGLVQKEAIRLINPLLLQIPINPKPIPMRIEMAARAMLGPIGVRKLKALLTRSGIR